MTLLRKEIADLQEYSLKPHPCSIKLNQNENPFELPDDIKDEILFRLRASHWSRYPDFVPGEQIERVADFAGWRRDGVLLGNGSNDLLQLVITCVLERGKSVVISQPTFTLYKLLAHSLGARVVEVPMQRPFAFDVGRIVETARKSDASMIILCSPNNPTGTRLGREELKFILESTTALVALDEAYVHFSRGSLSGMLRDCDMLVVFQTFSKAMAAAGIRFGYALAAPELTKQLGKVKLPYGVNIFTLLAATVMIERWKILQESIGILVRERERVAAALTELEGVTVAPSSANFILFESKLQSPQQIFSALLERGILIRNVSSYPMLENALRVSIGKVEENSAFISAMKEIL